MRVGIHGDPAAHQIPGGIGVYVRRLVEQLLGAPDGNEYRVIVSKFPAAPLYTAWNYLGRPRVKGTFDIIHATGLAIPPARGAALVATVHDLAVIERPAVVPQPWRQVYRKGLRIAVSRADVICAVSAATRTALIDRYGVAPDRIVLTLPAPNLTPASERDDGVFQRLGIAEPFVLNVGTLEPRKNQVGLVRAFRRAGDRLAEHTLVIAGIPGWGRDALVQEIGDDTGRVLLTGRVTDAELTALYTRAAVFALPSLDEGFGLPMVEALAFGIPAVVSAVPALAEVAGDAAILVAATDTEQLADALVQLAQDDALRARLSAAARTQAARFSWAATAAATREAYAIAGARRRSHSSSPCSMKPTPSARSSTHWMGSPARRTRLSSSTVAPPTVPSRSSSDGPAAGPA